MTHYFLGQTLLAEREFLRPPLSYAFFCSSCGEVWGRVWTEGEPWKVLEVPCTEHVFCGVWDCWSVPGSFISTSIPVGHYQESLCLDLLPLAVLRREVAIHCDYYEKRQQNEQRSATNITA